MTDFGKAAYDALNYRGVNVKDLGAIGNGTNDDGVAINAAAVFAKSRNINTLIFPKGDYYTNIALTQLRDLYLIGDGRIVSTHKDNYYSRVRKTRGAKLNTINSFTYETRKNFAALKAKLAGTGTVKVGILGDSISTMNSTVMTGLKYGKATQTAGTEFTYGPNSLNNGDSYSFRFINDLLNAFPSVTFDFYNYAIGGKKVSEWNSQQTFNSVTKAWIDHMKDAAPDLLIIGYGMNCYDITEAGTYHYNLKSMIDYIKANFVPIPFISLVTTPKPTNELSDTNYGGYTAQTYRHIAAYTTRNIGKAQGCYIMDVDRIATLKRYGLDILGQGDFKERKINKITPASGVVVNNGTYTLPSTKNILFDQAIGDFVLSFFTTAPTTSNTGSKYIEIQYSVFGGKSNTMFIFPNNGTVAEYRNYNKYYDSTNFPTGSNVTTSTGTAFNDGSAHKIVLEKRGNKMSLYLDSRLILTDTVDGWGAIGTIQIFNRNQDDLTITQLQLFETESMFDLGFLPDTQMWGQYISGDTGTKAETGGNGVNHPTTLGLTETYSASTKEFIDWMILNT